MRRSSVVQVPGEKYRWGALLLLHLAVGGGGEIKSLRKLRLGPPKE
jgi:hypothetical protein